MLTAPIAITAGEPAGIGSDLCVQLAQMMPEANLTLIADRNLLEQRARLLNLPLGHLNIHHVQLAAPCEPGKLNAANSHYVLETLTAAT